MYRCNDDKNKKSNATNKLRRHPDDEEFCCFIRQNNNKSIEVLVELYCGSNSVPETKIYSDTHIHASYSHRYSKETKGYTVYWFSRYRKSLRSRSSLVVAEKACYNWGWKVDAVRTQRNLHVLCVCVIKFQDELSDTFRM